MSQLVKYEWRKFLLDLYIKNFTEFSSNENWKKLNSNLKTISLKFLLFFVVLSVVIVPQAYADRI